jgi:hypothetical protein
MLLRNSTTMLISYFHVNLDSRYYLLTTFSFDTHFPFLIQRYKREVIRTPNFDFGDRRINQLLLHSFLIHFFNTRVYFPYSYSYNLI